MLKISCAGWTFNDYFSNQGLTLERYIDICAELGLEGVELTQYYFPETGRAYLNGLKRQMLKRGLELAGTALGSSFSLPTEDERRNHIEFTKEWLDISARLGAPVLRVFAGPVPKGHSEEEAFGWAISGIKECAQKAEEVGVMLGVENHGGLTRTAEGLLHILESVGSDWVGALLDFGNYSKDPYREFEMIAPYAIMTHAKPISDFAGTRDYVDYRRVCQIMQNVNYRGFLSIEYEEQDKDAMLEVPRFAAYLKGSQL